MFSRLKQKVKEESSSPSSQPGTLLTSSNSKLKTSTKDSVSSSETAYNSSDDGGFLSIKTSQSESKKQDTFNHDFKENVDNNKIQIPNPAEQITITNEDNQRQDFSHESNVKIELKKLNESLLSQIEDLTVLKS